MIGGLFWGKLPTLYFKAQIEAYKLMVFSLILDYALVQFDSNTGLPCSASVEFDFLMQGIA